MTVFDHGVLSGAQGEHWLPDARLAIPQKWVNTPLTPTPKWRD